MVVLEDSEALAVVTVQPILRAEPHESLPILKDRVDSALREALFQGEAVEAYVLIQRE